MHACSKVMEVISILVVTFGFHLVKYSCKYRQLHLCLYM